MSLKEFPLRSQFHQDLDLRGMRQRQELGGSIFAQHRQKRSGFDHSFHGFYIVIVPHFCKPNAVRVLHISPACVRLVTQQGHPQASKGAHHARKK
jgi:hypothetical protein